MAGEPDSAACFPGHLGRMLGCGVRGAAAERQARGNVVVSDSLPVLLLAGARSPALSFECNLAKAILAYEEGGPSFCLDNGGKNLFLHGSASKCHRQATFHGFLKPPSNPKWL